MSKLQALIIPVTPFQQNCSLVFDDEKKVGAIVDPGGDVPRILEAMTKTRSSAQFLKSSFICSTS